MIITINSGSSSIKIQIFEGESSIASFHFKNYSEGNYKLEAELNNQSVDQEITENDYSNSVQFFFNLIAEQMQITPDKIEKIIHRIVHGGERFDKPTQLTTETISEIETFNDYAPLHNPKALEIVKKIALLYPNIKQFGVFDTSFHLTMPKENFLYGLPYGYYENIKVRKFGFHGISYQFIKNRLAENNYSRVIVCHLGSGSSICAIKDGASIATSFGFSPEENLIMATRSGEIDYSAVMFIKKKLGLNDDDISRLLNNESGLLGISGYTNNMKQLLQDYATNERAKLAIDMYINKIVEFIANFFVMLGGVDAIVFTGGVGSGSDIIRKMILAKLVPLGIRYDESKNAGQIDVPDFLDISLEGTKVLVIKTNEELQMIRSCAVLAMGS
ncbi:acetate/propionate family kinase [Candidatus Dojkabacteria bacterium]|uniref:Acetate kinase n=1 Tax=Candidatus Dojkabacteria bacterium TaxID=2099670 RepID=A0A955LAB1_9BACT|nr:acetate/propionate family kinase [Candidatus Dojkabacteria bacterium]